MSFQWLYDWADGSAIGAYINDRTWPFPLIETFHIIALAVFLGALFVVDLRLMGLKFGGITASKMMREMNRWVNWGIVVILVTGVMLFSSEGGKLQQNAAFSPKMVLLAAALVFHYTVHRRAVAGEQPPLWAPAAGLVSQALWLGVGAAGRAIGFV